MNRQRLEADDVDRRRVFRARILSFSGASALAVVALWSAGFPFIDWLSGVRHWFSSPEENSAVFAVPGPALLHATNVPPASPEVPSLALAGTDSSVSPIPLALLLVGTSPGRNVREGTARIGVDPANPQTYVGGALFGNGARLTEIHKDYVLLERDGRSVRLYIKGTKNESRSTSDLLMVGGSKEIWPILATSTEPLTDYLRPSPVYDGQILRGYEVYPGQKAGVFNQLALQPGDVVTSLDQVPLSEPVTSIEKFRQLMSGVAMVATVERKGESKTVTLDGALILDDQQRSKAATPVVVAGMTEP